MCRRPFDRLFLRTEVLSYIDVIVLNTVYTNQKETCWLPIWGRKACVGYPVSEITRSRFFQLGAVDFKTAYILVKGSKKVAGADEG